MKACIFFCFASLAFAQAATPLAGLEANIQRTGVIRSLDAGFQLVAELTANYFAARP